MPPIIAMPPLSFRSDDRASRSPHECARHGAASPAGQSSADQAPEDGATDGSSDGFLGWRGRWRRRRIPTFDRRRRRIGCRSIRGFDRAHWDFVGGFDIRNVSRRPVHRLRIKIPSSVDVPPPPKSPIVPFVAPMSAIPSEVTVINVPAKIVRWQGRMSKVSLGTRSSPRRESDAVRALGAGLYQARPCDTNGRVWHRSFGRWLMLRLFVRVLLLLSDRTKWYCRHHCGYSQNGKRIRRLPHIRYSLPTHIRFGSSW
jgi:hypothetical protein